MIRNELVQRVNAWVDSLLDPFSDIDDLYETLQKAAGRIDHSAGSEVAYRQSWSLLPLSVCQSITGDAEKAIPVAVVLHMFNVAAELYDDMADRDRDDTALAIRNPAVAVNAATALVVSAQRMITRFHQFGVADRTAMEIIDVINGYYGTACSGQHLDLIVPAASRLSEETYFDILYRKSACTVECACHAGALVAGADRELLDSFRDFGKDLGISAQIANDIQGIIDLRDIESRQITLPVLFALNNFDGDSSNILRAAMLEKDETGDTNRIKTILYESGAMQYAMIQMQLYKEQALTTLSTLEDRGVNTGSFEGFI